MIKDLLKFIELTNAFQKVERIVLVKDSERLENTAEHSYQLSVTSLYLIDKHKLNLDVQKVLSFCIVHDLVEVYAGDTYIFGTQEQLNSKEQREHEAALRIQSEFPDFTSFKNLVEEYEARNSSESKFVYALDKILPMINIYLDNGRTWHRENVSLSVLSANKNSKVALDDLINRYYLELIEEIRSHPEVMPSTD